MTWDWASVDYGQAITNGLLIGIYVELLKVRAKWDKK